jgi:hypothetical protein
MMCFRHRLFFCKFSGVIAVSVLLSALAFAQHPVAPIVHPPVTPMHVSPPPMYRPPVMATPMTRPHAVYSPIYTPPLYNPPRTGMIRTPGTYGTSIVLPPVRPIRPIRPPLVFVYSPQFFFGDPFWRNSCWSTNCEFFWPWTFSTTTVSTPGPVNYVVQPPETPIYVYGGEREDFPQLFLKNGTILNVTDYWVVEGQLHFKVIEEPGQKPVEQALSFDDLDLQKTVDANTARGFRFVLRNAPFEEYAREHPEGPPPPALPPSHQQ